MSLKHGIARGPELRTWNNKYLRSSITWAPSTVPYSFPTFHPLVPDPHPCHDDTSALASTRIAKINMQFCTMLDQYLDGSILLVRLLIYGSEWITNYKRQYLVQFRPSDAARANLILRKWANQNLIIRAERADSLRIKFNLIRGKIVRYFYKATKPSKIKAHPNIDG